MLEIDGHIIFEKRFEEITVISRIRERDDFEKKEDEEFKRKPWFFYYGSSGGGIENFSFKTKRSASIARNKLIAAKVEYDRKMKEFSDAHPDIKVI